MADPPRTAFPVAAAVLGLASVTSLASRAPAPTVLYALGGVWAVLAGVVALTRERSLPHILVALGASLTIAAGYVAYREVVPPVVAPAAAAAFVASVLVCAAATPPATQRRSILLVLSVITWLSLVAGLLAAVGVDFPALYERNSRDILGVPQLAGIVGHPNTLGALAALAVVLHTAAMRDAWRGRTTRDPLRWQHLLAGPIAAAVTLLWSMSRGGWAAAAAGLVVLMVPMTGRAGNWGRPAVFFGILVLPFLPLIAAGLGLSTFTGRSYAWEVVWEQIRLDGAGGGGAAFLSTEFWAGIEGEPWSPGHAHHLVLEVLGRYGWLVTLVMAATLLTSLVLATRAARIDGTWALATGAVVATTGGLEPFFGVPLAAATFLLPLVAFAVLGASVRLAKLGPGGADQQRRDGGLTP